MVGSGSHDQPCFDSCQTAFACQFWGRVSDITVCLFNYVVMLFAAPCLLGIFCTLLVTVNNAYRTVNCFLYL